MTSLLFLTHNLQRAVYSLYSISKEHNMEIATKNIKVFGFVGTDHLRTKIIINDEAPEQVDHFTYLCCSTFISYQFSNEAESKLAKCLQLIGTIKITIYRKGEPKGVGRPRGCAPC